MREVFEQKAPELTLSLSSEVSPQMREYERFNTVCANAYVKPRMKSYLDRLTGRLAEAGATAPVYLMHSGGGIIGIESAAEFPVRLVESGPAGGAIFAAHIAAGSEPGAAIAEAVRYASHSVTGKGTQTSYATADEFAAWKSAG